jgi:hypothetical protein
MRHALTVGQQQLDPLRIGFVDQTAFTQGSFSFGRLFG